MGSKDKKKGSGRRSKTPGQTSASSPNPTATSPTGDATTTSLVPSSAFPSAPPTTTTTPQVVPSASPQPTSILASSTSKITTTQPLPSAPPPPPPVQETRQEFVSCTSEGSTTTDLPGPSTAPSESAARTRTSTFMPVTDEYLSLIAPAIACAMTALKGVKKEDSTDFQEMIVGLYGLKLDDMETVFGSLMGLAEMMKENAELKVSLENLFDMEGLVSAIKMTETLLAERKKRRGSGGSCGGSKGGSGSGEGDGEGGGVSA